MRQIARRLTKGIVLTVDYGHTASDLYSPLRKDGTLLCYYRETVSDNPYVRIGQQDITAHVDFTSLALIGEQEGLGVTGFTNQLHFLMGLGIEEAFAGLDPESKESGYLRRLLQPGGMGTTFKVSRTTQRHGCSRFGRPQITSFSPRRALLGRSRAWLSSSLKATFPF